MLTPNSQAWSIGEGVKGMQGGYWTQARSARIGRRRFVAMSGALGAAGFLLAACGSGGGNKTTGGAGASGLVTKAVDTTKQAKRGGVLKDRTFGDPSSLDGLEPQSPWNAIGPMVYSALVKFEPGYLMPTESKVVPDLAASWEFAPDGLSIIFKLRPGVKFHNKAPVNGRAFTTDDALFSWQRFATKGSNRASTANSADPSAPVLSLTATDASTLVAKLKEPLVYAPGLFAGSSAGGVAMVPKEADGGFDPKGDMIGTGPFVLSKYEPSVSFTMKRNPDFWEPDGALVDEVDVPIVSEYAASVAQFKAGNIYSFGAYITGPGVQSEDVLQIKQDAPKALLYQGDYGVGVTVTTSPLYLAFGYLKGSPFNDERVRRAVSMSLDRDLYIDTFFNVAKFQAAGLPVDTRWNTALPGNREGWWIDPKGKDFGPNSVYYQHNLEEAKKLMAAAGLANGIANNRSGYVTTMQLPDVARHAQVIDGMVKDIGINSNVASLAYPQEYASIRDGKGKYEGWGYKYTPGGAGGHPIGVLSTGYLTGGSQYWFGFDANGRGDQSGDPEIDDMITRGRTIRDETQLRSLVADIQRKLAGHQYAIPMPGPATTFTIAWPALGNFGVFRGSAIPNWGLWVDPTKPPLA